MIFWFENGCRLTEALVIGLAYDEVKEMYELTVLGLGRDKISYTEPGKAWFDDEDFAELIEYGEFEFPHEIVGRKLKLAANCATERVYGDGYEEI